MSLDPGAGVRVERQRPLGGQRAGGPGDERDLILAALVGLRLRSEFLDRVADVFGAELDVGQESLRESDVAGLVGLGVEEEEGWEEGGGPVELGAVFFSFYTLVYIYICACTKCNSRHPSAVD